MSSIELHARTRYTKKAQFKNKKSNMKKSYLQKLSLFVVVGFIVGAFASFASITLPVLAQSVGDLRQQSEDLAREIEENESEAGVLANKSVTLRSVIATFDGQIVEANNQIHEIDAEISRLEQELIEAQEEIERQKGILKTSMKTLYVRGGASTIELLAASDSFSEFIDEQEYLERLKTAMQESTNQVIALQEQIEEQKSEQEKLLAEQETTRNKLATTRQERSELLEQTEGQEALFRAKVEELQEKKIAAEAALAKALSAGSFRAAPVGSVAAGDVVGGVGNTGLSTGDHLHLEVRINGGRTNPAPYIKSQPVDSPPAWISQGYSGPNGYSYGQHSGIDYAAPNGTAVRAIDGGYMYRGCSDDILGTSGNDYGYVAIVEHDNGALSVYAHMSGGPSACDYNISPWFF
jgi:septal ring factor EnvC (AmiA/AmiB activator)